MTELDKRHRSSIYDSMVKSPNRAMMRATGMTDQICWCLACSIWNHYGSRWDCHGNAWYALLPNVT